MRARASFARLGALALVASVMLGGAACGLVAGLDKLTFEDPATCAAPCDDLDPCTQSDCLVDGACHGQPAPDGPAGADPSGNCQKITCAGGVAQSTADDTDVPEDDGNACTGESCAGGTPSHAPKPDGDPCVLGPGAVAGACRAGTCVVKCAQDLECDDQNACTTDVCDPLGSFCKSTLLDDGTPTPGVESMPGNCRTRRCVGGVDVDAPDDVDVGLSPSDCVTATCTNGELTLPPLPLDTPCTSNNGTRCDGAGTCVACNVTADCAPTGDDCHVAVCTPAKTCGTINASVGTPVSPAQQIAGDCKALTCDGNGGTMSKNDPSDIPDDGNACTIDKCTGGTPSNAAGPAGADCGVGQKCNAAGQCGCATSAQCLAPDTCGGGNPGTAFTCGCTKTTCLAAGATCGQVSDGCYATLSCDNGLKNGTETDVDCGGGGNCASTCAAGKVCKADGDCTSGHCADGVCCNSGCAGACMACNLAGSVGTCSNVAAGATDALTCLAPSFCDGAGTCKKSNGQTCFTNSQCGSGNCVDGYCCNSACTGTCLSCKVTGSLGTCTNVPSGQTDSTAAVTCVAPSSCDGLGACKKPNGQTCAAGTECSSGSCADGYCCNTTCAGTCTACNLAGALGTCSNIAAGQPDTNPANACAGTNLCDGAGVCKLGAGQPCTLDAECVSNFCFNLVCQ